MNEERFRNSTAGKVVRAGPDGAIYWAFVPHPLPPDIIWNDKIVQELSAADRALSKLSGLGQTLPNPHLLVRPFIQREALSSSRIEGTRADMSDIYSYRARQLPLPGMTSGATEEDIKEVLNYVEALEYGLERLASLPLSLRLLVEIHQRLMQGVRGEKSSPGRFRDRQNWISGEDNKLENARFVPPPPKQMQAALEEFEKFLHAEPHYPPLVRLALIHYQFEAIHPFIDGNGRIGRLLISLLTVHWNLLPLPLLYLSAFFEENRKRYYDLLLAISERGAWSEWLSFFLRGVAKQAQDANQRALALQDLQQRWHEQFSSQRSINPVRLVDLMFIKPIVSITEVKTDLGLSYPGAQYNVEKLVKAGILSQLGDAKYEKFYVAADILDILA